jgi:hypothetical protein
MENTHISDCKKHKWVINVVTASNLERTTTICVYCGKEKTLIDILDLTNEPNIIPDIIDKIPRN